MNALCSTLNTSTWTRCMLRRTNKPQNDQAVSHYKRLPRVYRCLIGAGYTGEGIPYLRSGTKHHDLAQSTKSNGRISQSGTSGDLSMGTGTSARASPLRGYQINPTSSFQRVARVLMSYETSTEHHQTNNSCAPNGKWPRYRERY